MASKAYPPVPAPRQEVLEAGSVTAQDWADQISSQWRDSVGGIVACGQSLIEAKSKLPYKSFQTIFPEYFPQDKQPPRVERPVPFSAGTAQRLMAVAKHSVLAEAAYTPLLPAAWYTLAILARLPPTVLEDALQRRAITGATQQNEAIAFVRKWREDNRPPASSVKAKTERELQDAESGEVQTDILIDGLHVLHGDFRERLSAYGDGTVDLIFTDPPYPDEFLPLFSDLAKTAARLLCDGGYLLCYSGLLRLPDVVAALNEHLTYVWTLHLGLDEGANSRIVTRRIIQRWKPVFVFAKGSGRSMPWHQDSVQNPAREKDTHVWQQGIVPALEWVKLFSPHQGVVCDPFLGGGTTAIAARRLGRQFIGCERDSEAFGLAVERILAEPGGVV